MAAINVYFPRNEHERRFLAFVLVVAIVLMLWRDAERKADARSAAFEPTVIRKAG